MSTNWGQLPTEPAARTGGSGEEPGLSAGGGGREGQSGPCTVTRRAQIPAIELGVQWEPFFPFLFLLSSLPVEVHM